MSLLSIAPNSAQLELICWDRDGAVVGAQGTLERMWVWRFYLPECCRGFLPARAEQQQLNTELETGFLSPPLLCPALLSSDR